MKLFYRHSGTGPPVVILHGLFGLSDNWVTFARSLSDNFTVYLPDLRNHGQSPHSNLFNFAALEDDLLEFFEDHGLENVVLMGHSLGGKIAMFFALHHPSLVKKLIVVDISLRRSPPSTEHQNLINAMWTVDFSKAISRSDVERQLQPLVKSEKLRLFLMKNVYWRDREKLDWRLNLKAIDENLLTIFEGITETGIYSGPALFVRGAKSPYVQDEDLPGIAQKFPGAVVKTISDAGHWVHADAPGEFLAIVKIFLDRESVSDDLNF